MRCRGKKEKGVPSTRQWSVSEDGGKTWSVPRTLKYDDGTDVFVPASIARFETHPDTGRIYWFANILSKPSYNCDPRYPLTIAELDKEKLCIKKDTVTVIQDLPGGATIERRYSNFGHYIDRVTGEFVLLVPEEPKIDYDDGTTDVIRFRIKL